MCKKRKQQIGIDYNKLAKALLKEKEQIDYDAITQAIVKAHQQVEYSDKLKEKERNKHRIELIKFINGVVYIMVTVIAVSFIISLWKNFVYTHFSDLLFRIIASIFSVISGIFGFLSQQESLDDGAENAILHFNSNMSLLALIVAIIALLMQIK